MAVLLEAISVIVPCEVIEAKFPGGREGYERAIPNQTFCADGYVTRVGFMHPEDVRAFVEQLGRAGLRLLGDRGFEDVAIVDQVHGPTRPCSWLRFGVITETGTRFCELASAPSSPGRLYVPEGWSPGDIRLRGPEDGDLEVVAMDGVTQTLRDPSTGRTFYIGRTSSDTESGSAPSAEWPRT